MDLDSLVKGLLSELAKVSRSDAVAGQVRDAGKAKVLPLSKISIGFGGGSGALESRSQGETSHGDAGLDAGGAFGAMVVEPRAFVVVGEDGVPHMLAMRKGKAAVLRRGLELTSSTVSSLPATSAPARLDDGKRKK